VKEKFLLILAVLVLITASALGGGPVDVEFESDFGSAGFSAPIAEMTSSSPPGPIGFTLSITARVWLNDVTGIYTYVYEFTDNGTSFGGITSVSIDTADFDSSLNWGTVGGSLSSAFNTTFSDHLTFQFSPGMPSGGTYTVYAQSTQPPQEYLFWGSGFGPSGTGSYTLGADPPLYVAEAPSLLFLGTGLLGVVGIGFFRQKFS